MQLESPEGEVRLIEMGPQSICYVPPFWIHRSVNTGPGDLVMMFAYPADSGQDYGIIERSGGLRVRIVDNGGRLERVENPDWRPRAPEEIERHLRRRRGRRHDPCRDRTGPPCGRGTSADDLPALHPAHPPFHRGHHRRLLDHARLSRTGRSIWA